MFQRELGALSTLCWRRLRRSSVQTCRMPLQQSRVRPSLPDIAVRQDESSSSATLVVLLAAKATKSRT